jgi:hypothetical protein
MDDKIALARRHVIEGFKIVARQRQIVEQTEALGQDATDAKKTLRFLVIINEVDDFSLNRGKPRQALAKDDASALFVDSASGSSALSTTSAAPSSSDGFCQRDLSAWSALLRAIANIQVETCALPSKTNVTVQPEHLGRCAP